MIRIFDKSLGKWVELASTHASRIQVSDPKLIGEDPDNPTTNVEDALIKQYDELDILKKNLAWIYKNGSIGGGGGGGGSSDTGKFSITSHKVNLTGGGNVIYVGKTENVNLIYEVVANKVGKSFIINATLGDQTLIKDKAVLSGAKYSLPIGVLESGRSHILSFSGADEEGFTMESYQVSIIAGAINLVNTSGKDVVEVYTNQDPYINLKLSASMSGKTIQVKYWLNDATGDPMGVKEFSSDVESDVRFRLKDLTGGILNANSTYVFRAIAEIANDDGTSIQSDPVTITFLALDSESLLLTIRNVRDSYNLGEEIMFNYNVSCLNYKSFKLSYRMYSDENPGFTVGDPNNPDHPDNLTCSSGENTFSYLADNSKFEAGIWHVELTVMLKDKGLKVTESTDITLKTSSFAVWQDELIQGLVAKFDPRTQNNPNLKEWVVTNSQYDDGSVKGKTVKMTINSTNGVTSGIVNNELTGNLTALRLTGGAYAVIDLTPFDDPNWFSSGFCLSVTYSHDDTEEVNSTVMDIASYTSDGFSEGILLTQTDAKMSASSGSYNPNIGEKVAAGRIITVDFVYEINSDGVNDNFLKVYVDGILTGVQVDNINGVSFKSSKKIYLGAKFDTILKDFGSVNIYNIKLYDRSLRAHQIVKNWINTDYYLHKIGNEYDVDKNKQLRTLNYFNDEGVCQLVSNNQYMLTGIYNTLSVERIPKMKITIKDGKGTEFKNAFNTIYTTEDSQDILNLKFPCSIQYEARVGGKNYAITLDNCFVSMQGTTSLTYYIKNLEIFFGNHVNEGGEIVEGKERLFTPDPNWLPENRFTLKADVIDSSHSNNTCTGRFLNNSGYFSFKLPPMEDSSNPCKDKVKYTLDGFPMLLFIDYNEKDANLIGVYNFNMGRGSYFNLGLKCFTQKPVLSNEDLGIGYVVNDYQVKTTGLYSNTNCFSYEINQNNVGAATFSQHHESWIDSQMDLRFPYEGIIPEIGKTKLQSMLNDIATTNRNRTVILKLNADGSTEPLQYDSDGNPVAYTQSTDKITLLQKNFKIPALTEYFMIAIAIGMIDSLGKNIVLRTWDASDPQDVNTKWYPCFYDMDTLLGINNSGNIGVEYTAYIHKYYNSRDEKLPDGSENPEKDDFINQLRVIENTSMGGYDCYNSVLWNTLLEVNGQGSADQDYFPVPRWQYYRSLDSKGESDPSGKFVSTTILQYFEENINKVGATLYNVDYQSKYLTKAKKSVMNPDGTTTETNTYNDLMYVHGTRVAYVKDWLVKRLRFLDSVFTLSDSKKIYPESVLNSTITFRLSDTDGSHTSILPVIAKSTMISKTVTNTLSTSVLLREGEAVITTQTGLMGDTQYTMNCANSINYLVNINQYSPGYLKLENAISLIELNLSGCKSFTNANAFSTAGCKALKDLNLSQCGTALLKAELGNCYNLKSINIENSSVSSLELPGSGGSSGGLAQAGVLDTLGLRGSKIQGLVLENQPFIKSIDVSNCSNLKDLSILNCESLTELIIQQSSISSLQVTGCGALESITATDNTNLRSIVISECGGIHTLDFSGCNNENFSNEISLAGAENATSIKLSGIKAKTLILSTAMTKLKTLDLSDTAINATRYGDVSDAYNDSPMINVNPLTGLTTFLITNNQSVEYINFGRSKSNPFRIATADVFMQCTSLKRVFGHLELLTGRQLFYACPNFFLNPEKKSGSTTVTESNTAEFSGYNTNIWFNSACKDLYRFLSGTSVTAYDMYYILNRIPTTLTSLSTCFYNCQKIVTSMTDPLKRDTFNKCLSVTSMNSIFGNNKNMAGPLYSPLVLKSQFSNGLLSPCKSVTDLGSAFSGTGFEWVDHFFFYSDTSYGPRKVTSIYQVFASCENLKSMKYLDSFSGNYSGAVQGYLDSMYLFNYLPALTNCQWWCRNTKLIWVEFKTTVTNDTTYIFHNNPKLSTAYGAFEGVIAKGTLKSNLFGGKANIFSTAEGISCNMAGASLTTLYRAFAVAAPTDGSAKLTIDFTTMDDLFVKCKNLTTIREMLSGSLDKSGTLPQNIFKGLTKLQYANNFFDGANLDWNGVFPLMFEDNKELRDVTALFRGNPNLRCKLPSLLFKNCQLTSISYLFSGCKGIQNIPYRLFYMEYRNALGILTVRKSITAAEYVFENCTGLKAYVHDEDEWPLEIYPDADDGLNDEFNPSGYTYICPKDMFSAISNDVSTSSIDYFFSGVGGLGSESDADLGFTGRIPAGLFDSLTRITKLNGVFKGVNKIKPYSEGGERMNEEGEVEIVEGKMYPDNLLFNLKNITSVKELFTNETITKPIGLLFNANTKINNMYMTFYCCRINSDCISGTFLNKLTELSDVRYAFASGSEAAQDWTGRGIQGDLPQSLFMPYTSSGGGSGNKIKNADRCFCRATNMTGNAIKFWPNKGGFTTLVSNVYMYFMCEGLSDYADIPAGFK